MELKPVIQNSRYLLFWQNNRNLIIFSLLMAIVFSLISYPGIIYSDSYVRIDFAYQLKDILKNFIWKDGKTYQVWLTPTPSYFIAVFKWLTGSIAMYTVVQAFSFYFLSFVLIKKMCYGKRLLCYLLFAVNPIFFCVGVYFEAGIGCLIGIMGLILLLNIDFEQLNGLDKCITFCLYIFFSFVIFGFRANAFTIIPIIFRIILRSFHNRYYKLICYTSIVIGLLLVFLIPKVLHINTRGSAVAGFAWEIVTVIGDMPEEKQNDYITYLDDITSSGATAIAVKNNNRYYIWPSLNNEKIHITFLSEPGKQREIIQKYLNLFIAEPEYFIKNKINFIDYTLGITRPLSILEWDYNRWNRMDDLKFNDSKVRKSFYTSYLIAGDKMALICRPFFLFILAYFLVILSRKCSNRCIYFLKKQIFWISVFYYLAFVLNNQSFEFRYFYPSYHMLALISITSIINMLDNAQFRRG